MNNKAMTKWVLTCLMLLCSFGIATAQGVAWEDLSDAQRTLLADQEPAWQGFEPERQSAIARGAQRWLEMRDSDRAAARERYDKT